MSEVTSIACRFPVCHNTEEKETTLSFRLRVTAIVLGIITALVGVLIFSDPFLFNCVGATGGWSILALGTLLVIVGTTVKSIKKKNPAKKEKAIRKHQPTQALSSATPPTPTEPIPITPNSIGTTPTLNEPSSSLETAHAGSIFSMAAALALEGSTEPFDFPMLPMEMKLELLNKLDIKTLSAFSLTNKENYNLIKSEYLERILEARFKEHAFRTWVKSVQEYSKEDDYFIDENTQELLSHYAPEMIEVLANILSEIERMPDKQAQSKAFDCISIPLISVAWNSPVNASGIVDRALNIVLKNLNDQNVCSCAEAMSAIDPDRALSLYKYVEKNDYALVKIFLSFIKGLAPKDFKTSFQFVHELTEENDKLQALTSIIKASSKRSSIELNEILKTALDIAAPMAHDRSRDYLLFAIGAAYLGLNDFEKALEMVDALSDISIKGDLISRIIVNYDCKNEHFEKLLDRIQKLTMYGNITEVRIASKIFKTDAKRAEEIFKRIIASKEDVSLAMIVDFYIPINLEKAIEIAKQIRTPYIKIDALLAIVSKSKQIGPLFSSHILDEAISYIPQIKEKPRDNFNLPKDSQKIESICRIARQYAFINPKKAEELLERANRIYDTGGFDEGDVISPLAGAYAVIDFPKAITMIKKAFGTEHSLKASIYLEIAKSFS